MKRRWLPRIHFSLRTLLLLVLTAASGATLWWNWGPWEIAFTITEPGVTTQVFFSDDDRYVMFSYSIFSASDRGWRYLDIRHADTGAPYALIKSAESGYITDFKGDYILMAPYSDGTPIKQPLTSLFNWRDGKQLTQFPKDSFLIGGRGATSRLSGVTLSRTHVASWTDEKCSVFQLPALTRMAEWSGVDEAQFLEDGRLAIYHHGGLITIHNLLTGKGIEAQCRGKRILSAEPSNRFVPVALTQAPHPSSCLLDTVTGRTTCTIPGEIAGFSRDGRLAIVRNKTTSQGDIYELQNGNNVKTFTWQFADFSPDGKYVIEWDYGDVSNTSDFKLLYKTNSARRFSENGKFLTGSDFILDAQDGKLLMSMRSKLSRMLSAPLHPGESFDYKIVWCNRSPDFALLTDGETHPKGAVYHPFGDDWKRASIWRLRRPYQWFGPAYLPEFWLTTLLTLALIWSIIRDRRNA